MKLFTEQRGSGPYLILLHGLFGSQDNLAGLARVAEPYFTVLSIDLPNHGRSPHVDSMNYPQMAQAVLDSLPADASSFYLLGHSMGGKTAIQIALMAPERVKALLVADIAPVQYDDRHSSIIDAMLSVQLDNLSSRQDADQQLARSIQEAGVRQFLLKNLVKEGGQFQWRCNLPVIARCYPQVLAAPEGPPYTGPVLFIKGANSNYIEAGHQSAIQALLPQAKAKVIHGAGHWLHAEKPAAFNKIVLDFLQAQTA
ncbi:alpha/beta fold hydrolase [Alkalimonas sp.]|uniref:alpha/beta fold hydrolase n=1 Tax=Alkalimonas sp. TaxID=1872453 RepID=UPI00263B374C|nr:alpha/beta fold hydrolase [Alkalimonas sp.]MCC5824744.1 alpha/beta fold hydrolase [Alkalimonas sp.]